MKSQGARKTHQRRSEQTRDALLTALEALLHEKDFDDISVNEIAARAGVSPASIYRRFDKKEGFIPVLLELYLKRLNEWAASPEASLDLEGVPLREALKMIARSNWWQLTSQAHIMRAIHIYGRKHAQRVEHEFKGMEDAMLASMKAIITLYAHEVTQQDHGKAAGMLAYYLNNIYIERGLFRDDSPDWELDLSDEEFCDQIADFAYGYLTL
ncbi:TetR/AcrR family transcriptional regulator [Kordiimonas sp. SCSIO 12610]|uniref:TetR/AcrR family transcriptional regulator n=1 Tax=Kordiimonas sp. SCSIO 12610 TaxID=2829597 RepID=UPI00210D7C86|nr:TetR/AcrR family transcriptional regulator [Kordiimonas sp. SCSIO 12610]UTW56223.1 TetR/AcrR family transcriptional regulator [Kordiimonas sp. SCSIO 12610]